MPSTMIPSINRSNGPIAPASVSVALWRGEESSRMSSESESSSLGWGGSEQMCWNCVLARCERQLARGEMRGADRVSGAQQ
eukprot:scaffold259098_cov31-Tisochrysis_lutea.AAC.1